MTIPVDTLHTLATDLLDSVVLSLVDYNLPRPNRLYVAAGTPDLVAWDDCCEGTLPVGAEPGTPPPMGQLTVAMSRLFRTRTFPAEDLTQRGGCDETRLAMTLDVELVRCSSVVDEDDDVAPSQETLDAEGLRLLSDAVAFAQGLHCQIERWLDLNRLAVFAGMTPNGPAGSCVGHRATVIVEAISSCFECPPA